MLGNKVEYDWEQLKTIRFFRKKGEKLICLKIFFWKEGLRKQAFKEVKQRIFQEQVSMF